MRIGGYQNYRKTSVLTADPKRLVIMCYEETIRNLRLASLAYSSRNYVTKGKAVQKALDIMGELRGALDFERGGTVAISLENLYVFMTKHTIESDRARNVQGFERVASMLEVLKSAWEKIFFGQQEESMEPDSDIDPGFKPSERARPTQSAAYGR